MKLIRGLIISLLSITVVSCQVQRPDNVPDGATYNNKGGYAWHFCEQANNTLYDFPLYKCTGYNGDGSIYNSGMFVDLAQQNLSPNHKLNQFPAYGDWWKGKRLHLVYKFRENTSFVKRDGDAATTELRGYQLWFMSNLCLRDTEANNIPDLNVKELTNNGLLEIMKSAPSLFHDKIEKRVSEMPKHVDAIVKQQGCWVLLEFRL